MKNRIEIQLIVILLCGLVFAAAWIGIQAARDNVGVWSESAELHFTTAELVGLAPRSELRCAGAVVGHVRKIESTMQYPGTIKVNVIRETRAIEFAK